MTSCANAIFIPGDDTSPERALLGGKAFNLHRLAGCGVVVPGWIALMAGFPRDDAASAKTAIMQAMDAAGLGGRYFAVRSSAVGEDGVRLSFAGLFESFLFVPRDAICRAVEGVWASALSGRVADYCKRNGIEPSALKVAVIVQEMVDAECSGVAFGVDLQTGSRAGSTISAVYGLGEGLVLGRTDADTYYAGPDGLRREVASKDLQVVFANGDGGGTVEIPVEPALRDSPVLTDARIQEVAAAVRSISAQFGRIQDIEWAYGRDGRLIILQSRPVTTLAMLPDPSGTGVLWDNSNIVESYPGQTQPLTFSFIREVYTEVYIQFCLMMGVEREVIDANPDVFEMLGLIKGRVYYNLLNWYRMLMLLPGYEINAGFMEQMMGVKVRLDEKPTVVPSRRWKYGRVASLAWRMLCNLMRHEKSVAAFTSHFNALVTPLENRSFAHEPPQWIVAQYGKLESGLLRAWQPPLVNDFFAMIAYGMLKKVLVKWDVSPGGTLQNDLLVGVGDIISAEPMRRLTALAATAGRDAALVTALVELPSGEFIRRMGEFPEFEQEFNAYIARFGIRCMGELKLETVTYAQNPALLVDIIRSYVTTAADSATRRHTGAKEDSLHDEARRRVSEKLAGHPLRALWFNFLLRHTRRLVANRENMRFERTRLFAVVRNMFLGIGATLRNEGVIEETRDIFMLTKDEVFGFINGTGVSCRLADVIRLRKEEYSRWAHEPAPSERFRTIGMVHHGNRYSGEAAVETPATPGAGGVLRGIGCCGGVVRGTARVVSSPEDVAGLGGRILVARRTDPGWGPLFPVTIGVLVERGSVLSHAAILTRELGIPSVVAVSGLMDAVADGDEIELDGSAGTVRIIRKGGGDENA